MNRMYTARRCVITSATLMLALLAGCASSAGSPPAGEIPRCVMQETLVCYDRAPSRLGKSDSDRFCHCENIF